MVKRCPEAVPSRPDPYAPESQSSFLRSARTNPRPERSHREILLGEIALDFVTRRVFASPGVRAADRRGTYGRRDALLSEASPDAVGKVVGVSRRDQCGETVVIEAGGQISWTEAADHRVRHLLQELVHQELVELVRTRHRAVGTRLFERHDKYDTALVPGCLARLLSVEELLPPRTTGQPGERVCQRGPLDSLDRDPFLPTPWPSNAMPST